MIDFTCKICGKVFPIKPSRLKTARTCSKECRYRWASLHPPHITKPTKGFKIQGGYKKIYKPDHPRATKANPYIMEQVLVMEEKLGRYLRKEEIVHHLNEDKQDNRLENLVILTPSEHNKVHKKKANSRRSLRRLRQLKGQGKDD